MKIYSFLFHQFRNILLMLLPSSPPPHLSEISLKSHLSALFEDDTEKQNHYRFIFFFLWTIRNSVQLTVISRFFFHRIFFQWLHLKKHFELLPLSSSVSEEHLAQRTSDGCGNMVSHYFNMTFTTKCVWSCC